MALHSSTPARQRTGLVIGLAMASVAIGHGFGRMSYALVLPAMTRDLVGTYGRAGWLSTANLIAYLLGLLVMIGLSRRVALAHFLQVGLLGTTAGLALLALAPNYPALAVGMVMTGGFNAAIWVPATALVASAVPEHRRGLAVGALGAGFGLAIALAGQVIVRGVHAAAGEASWRPVWAVEAVLGAAVVVAVMVGLRPRPVERRGPGGLRLSALTALPGAAAIIVTYAAFALGLVLYTNYLVEALHVDAGFSSGHASTVYSLVGLANIGGGLLVGRLSDRLGRRTVLIAAQALLATCSAAVLLGREPWVSASAVVTGMLVSGLPAVVGAYVADHLEPDSVASAFGVVTIAFGVTQAVGPPVGGWAADRTGSFTVTFLLAVAAFAVGAVAAWILPRGRVPAPERLPA